MTAAGGLVNCATSITPRTTTRAPTVNTRNQTLTASTFSASPDRDLGGRDVDLDDAEQAVPDQLQQAGELGVEVLEAPDADLDVRLQQQAQVAGRGVDSCRDRQIADLLRER